MLLSTSLAESKSENFSELKLSVSSLYLLAAPSTPDPVRDEIVTRAKGGEKLKHKTVKEAVAKARPADQEVELRGQDLVDPRSQGGHRGCRGHSPQA